MTVKVEKVSAPVQVCADENRVSLDFPISAFTKPWHHTQNRILSFDVLRSLAILLIVIGHIGFAHIPFSTGRIGVSLFLILSGMTMECVYGGRTIDPKKFYVRRILRIYPTYFLSLIMATVILGVDYLPGNFTDAILTVTGFCAFAGKWGCSLIETSWFIGLIMSLYAIYPYLSRLMRRSPYSVICILFVISVLSTLVIREYQLFPRLPLVPEAPLAWFPLCRIFEFGLGIFLVNQHWVGIPMDKSNLSIFDSVFRYTSEISFPVFLIHYPLLSVIKFWRGLGGTLVGLAVYFVLTLLLGHILLVLDTVIQRKARKWFDS
jgi:peptidoglycan/LPS O-acetylase OafA/YrhL